MQNKLSHMSKHLDFYFDCMNSGILPTTGLCHCAEKSQYIDAELFELFKPTEGDYEALCKEGVVLRDCGEGYWAAGAKMDDIRSNRAYGFTPLRQTIILFMAAINNEL